MCPFADGRLVHLQFERHLGFPALLAEKCFPQRSEGAGRESVGNIVGHSGYSFRDRFMMLPDGGKTFGLCFLFLWPDAVFQVVGHAIYRGLMVHTDVMLTFRVKENIVGVMVA